MKGNKNRASLADWVDAHQSSGRYAFSREEALKELRISRPAFDRSAARLGGKKRLARIYRGLYVIVPLEYAAAGITPPEWFIGDLMAHLKEPYYIGLLTAAAYHGAAHQRPQTFQVVTGKSFRAVECRGVAIRFFFKQRLSSTPQEQVQVPTGYLPVSTPEGTAFDLLRYARRIGGLDRVLTVLQELGEKIDAGKLFRAAAQSRCAAHAQRLGWLLERAKFGGKVDGLVRWLKTEKPLPAKLDPALPLRGSHFDQRWQLWINAAIEGDLD